MTTRGSGDDEFHPSDVATSADNGVEDEEEDVDDVVGRCGCSKQEPEWPCCRGKGAGTKRNKMRE
jgi:hypothetical protein